MNLNAERTLVTMALQNDQTITDGVSGVVSYPIAGGNNLEASLRDDTVGIREGFQLTSGGSNASLAITNSQLEIVEGINSSGFNRNLTDNSRSIQSLAQSVDDLSVTRYYQEEKRRSCWWNIFFLLAETDIDSNSITIDSRLRRLKRNHFLLELQLVPLHFPSGWNGSISVRPVGFGAAYGTHPVRQGNKSLVNIFKVDILIFQALIPQDDSGPNNGFLPTSF